MPSFPSQLKKRGQMSRYGSAMFPDQSVSLKIWILFENITGRCLEAITAVLPDLRCRLQGPPSRTLRRIGSSRRTVR